jgi:hypothetical protein
MKRIFFFFLAALPLLGCEDVVDVNIPKGQPLLAVDGAITDQPGPYTVTLTKTAPYFSETELPRVSGAVLVLQDDQGQTETLSETSPGTYTTNGTVQGRIGGRYTLTIRSEGQEYRAETEIRRTPEIDSLRAEFRGQDGFRDEGYYVLYYGKELPGEGDYYRFKIFRNGVLLNEPSDLIVTDDEFVDGNYINGLELNDDPFEKNDLIRVEASSLPRDYYFFLNELLTQINNGGLFASPPANVRTNVRNLTSSDPTKAAVGYFAGYTVRTKSIRVP